MSVKGLVAAVAGFDQKCPWVHDLDFLIRQAVLRAETSRASGRRLRPSFILDLVLQSPSSGFTSKIRCQSDFESGILWFRREEMRPKARSPFGLACPGHNDEEAVNFRTMAQGSRLTFLDLRITTLVSSSGSACVY